MLSALAPARRRLVLAVCAVGALALVVVLVLAVTAGGRGPGAVAAPAVDQSVPGPVLLVPGYGGSTEALGVLAEALRAGGRDASVVALPGEGTGDLTEQAGVLDAAVAQARSRTGAASVDVVGYSAGGVVVRLWAAELGGAAQARRIVTLGSPHHGTQVAGLAAGLLPGQCPTACRQLTPDSPLLADLNAGDETPDGPRWTTVWTTQDRLVTPPETARLDGAEEVVVQDVCAGADVDHGNLPRDPLVGAIVAAALGEDPDRAPGPQDCAALSS